MQKIIKKVSGNVMQVTIADSERWYVQTNENQDGTTSEIFIPSTTWICSYLPKGIGYMKWLSQNGWDESIALMKEAGVKGSKVHQGISYLLDGETINMGDKILNKETGESEEVTLEEYEILMTFVRWYNKVKPKVIAKDFLVMNNEYAGMVDLLCTIDGQTYLVDFKTSQDVYDSHEIQVSAYLHALPPQQSKDCKTAILQIGYRRNKDGYKFTEIEDKFDLFLSAYNIWEHSNRNVQPKKKDYPMSLSLDKEG